MKSCTTCRFSHAGPPLHCRLHPPHVVNGSQSSFPVATDTVWCWSYRRSLVKWVKRLFNKGN
jgi:hypothetical protein